MSDPQKLLAEIKTLRDEIKLKIHLAGMDLKDSWKRLEPRVEELERDLAKAGKDVGVEARAALEKAKEAFTSFKDRLQKPKA